MRSLRKAETWGKGAITTETLFFTTEAPFDAFHLLPSTGSGQAGQAETGGKG